jgi:hypothetical protein
MQLTDLVVYDDVNGTTSGEVLQSRQFQSLSDHSLSCKSSVSVNQNTKRKNKIKKIKN